MGRKSLVFGILVLLICFLALTSARAEEPIKVGIVLPLTGDQAKFGEIEKQSFELAFEEINSQGGINGRPIQALIEDDTGRPEVGRSVVEKLITKDKVVMIGGGYSSSVTFAVAGVCQQNQIPFLVNTGSADEITEQGWDYIFRLNQPASEYASGMETLLSEVVKPKTVAILHENSLFGTSQASSFEKTAKKLNIEVVMKEGYEHGGIDFKPVLVKVKNKNPDLVYMVSYVMDAALLMKQSMELKLTPKLFVGGGAGFTLPEFQQNAGKASEKVISATLWHQVLPYPGAKEYYDKFVKKYNKETEYHGAQAYAAAYVIGDVLKRAKSLKPQDIKEALEKTNLMTAFGPVRFIAYGKMKNQNKLPTYVVQWIDGKLELVWPKDLATKPLVYPVNWLKEWGY